MTRFVFPAFVALVALTASATPAPAGGQPAPAMVAANAEAAPIGAGDGRIHIIPSIGKPSLKNGEKLTVSAVVKSQAPIAKVTADLGGKATLELKAKPIAGLGGLPGGGFAAVYEAEWTAAGLEEKIYDVAITATDAGSHAFTDRSLRFSDPAAGISTAGTSVSASGGMSRAGVAYGLNAETVSCSVIDTANGYAYFGTSTTPGKVVKVALGAGAAAPARAGAVTLNSGENKVNSAAIDTSNGYAYFGTGTSPGRVVKVALGTGAAAPARVGAATLNSGEDSLASAAIDPVNGYAYFGTYTFPGRVVKVALGAGATAPARVGAATLNSGEDGLQSAAIDTDNGYAYFGTQTSPGQVVKVALGAGAAAPARVGAVTLNSGEDQLRAAAIDTASGYAYFGTLTSPGQVVKVALGAGAAAPARVGAVTLNSGESYVESAVIDTANGCAYIGTLASPGQVVKVALGAGAAAPARVGAVTLNSGEDQLRAAAIDTASGYAYFGTSTLPGQVVKVALGAGAAPPARVGAATLNPGDDRLVSAAIDTANGYAYFGTSMTPGRVVKLALGAGSSAPARVGAATLNSGEDYLVSAAIDTANGYAYFGTATSPGRVVKVALGSGAAAPARVGAVTFNSGEDRLYSVAMDTANGYAYFGTLTAPGQVVKVALGAGATAPARVGAVTLNSGEDLLYSAAIDTANGYAYFGTNTISGRVVKVALGAGSAAPARVGAVTLNSGENRLVSAAIDTANGYAYFGTSTSPGQVVKVALGAGAAAPARVGAVTLNSGEGYLQSAAIDTADGYAYFGANTIPGRVVKVALGAGAAAPARVGAATLNSGENYLVSAAIDTANGYAYFGTLTYPGQVVSVSLRDSQQVKSTRMTMPEAGAVDDFRFYSHTAAGAVRLALYDDATTRNLLWESSATNNTVAEGFVTVPVAAGYPTSLNLTTGTYHLAWQASADSGVPSYLPGAAGTGFTLPYSRYGPFPAAINTNISGYATDENWTQFLTYTAATSPTTATVSVVHDFAPPGGGGAPAGFATLTQLGAGSVAEYDSTGTALLARVAAGPGFRVAGWFSLARAQQLPVSTVGPDRIARARFAIHAGGQADPGSTSTIPNMRFRLASRFSVNSMLELFHHTGADPTNDILAGELRPSLDPARPSFYTVDLDPVDVPYYSVDLTECLLVGFEAYSTAADTGDNGYIAAQEITIGSYPKSFTPDSAAPVRTMAAGDLTAAGGITSAFNAQGTAVLGDPAGLLGTATDGTSGTALSTANVPADRIGVVTRDFPVGLDPAPENRIRVEPGRQYHVRFHLTSTQATSLNGQITMRARSGKFAYVHKLQVGGGNPTNNVAGQTIARQALPGPGGANPDNDGAPDANRGGWYNLVFRTPLDPDIRGDGAPGATIGQLMPTFLAEPGPGIPTTGSRRDLRVGLDLIDTLDAGPGAANEVGQVAVDRIEFRSYPAVGN